MDNNAAKKLLKGVQELEGFVKLAMKGEGLEAFGVVTPEQKKEVRKGLKKQAGDKTFDEITAAMDQLKNMSKQFNGTANTPK